MGQHQRFKSWPNNSSWFLALNSVPGTVHMFSHIFIHWIFPSHNYMAKMLLLLSPFYKWENWDIAWVPYLSHTAPELLLASDRPHCIFYVAPARSVSYALAVVSSPHGAWISSGTILGFGTPLPDPKYHRKDQGNQELALPFVLRWTSKCPGGASNQSQFGARPAWVFLQSIILQTH